MTQDLMSAEEWGAVWESRRKESGFKSRVKDVVLYGFIVMIRRWIRRCGAEFPSVIELGCAPGVMLRWINRACPEAELQGLDYSQNGIDQTKIKMAESGIKVDLMQNDIFSFTPSKLSDLVVSFGLIEHFRDPVEMLRMHRKFAKPSGWVAVTVPNFSHPQVIKALRRSFVAALNRPPAFRGRNATNRRSIFIRR